MKQLVIPSKLILFALPLFALFAFSDPITLAPAEPDLYVRGIQFPEGFKIGNCTDVKVAIGNKGNHKSGSFKVELYLSQSGSPVKKYYLVVKNIYPNKLHWVTFKNIKVAGKGQAKLQATADYGDSVEESDEYNNKKLVYPKPTAMCKLSS